MVTEGYKQDRMFDETTWSNLDSDLVDCYIKSKTLAEKSAWDFIKDLPENKKYSPGHDAYDLWTSICSGSLWL